MKYIFFILIFITLFYFILHKNKKKPFLFLLVIILGLMLVFPNTSLEAAKEGINLSLFIVIPSLFPFFIINDMMISLRVPENISKLFSPIVRIIFNTSGYGAYVFIMSIFSGYPAGAKIASQLVEEKKITSDEGLRILSFSSTSGPLFIIGAVGSGMLKSSAAGYILFLSHILGSVLNGIFFRIFFRKNRIENKKQLLSPPSPNIAIGEMMSRSIVNSLITIGYIIGYIVLFSVIIALLNKIEFFAVLSIVLHQVVGLPFSISNSITTIFETAIEISNGCKILSNLPTAIEIKMIFSSFIIAFSGLSVICQAASIINKSRINLNVYIFSKLTHGVLASLVCYLFIKLNLFSITTISMPATGNLLLNPVLIIELLLILLLILNTISSATIKLRHLN